MAKQPFVATKTRSSRPGWTITFRHPMKTDSQNKAGRKIRRGLNTQDSATADQMVEQMNEILSEMFWWNPMRRREAEARFAPEIVAAFYDDLAAPDRSAMQLREQSLPLPGKEQGYSKVLFVGTTGAGKTTLLRQLIGSDPELDRFPSTAPAKTTIADIEVVLADGPFEAVVTFFPEFQIQALIEECVLDAALAARDGSVAKVAERFLNHRDQRFRLSYVLGPYRSAQGEDDDFSFDEDEVDSADVDTVDDDGNLPDDERDRNHRELEGFVARIEVLAQQISAEVEDLVKLESESLGTQDRETLNDLIEEAFEAILEVQEDYGNLVQDILDAILVRFSMVTSGRLDCPPGKWPKSWNFTTEDRGEFIRTIRWFSSNFWPHFGRLLTPVVDGMRVRGPLYPEMRPHGAKLVFMDGQGLGHTPDYGASISTNITERFPDVDVILLVDNAQQPMQTAPLSVMRAVASTGHADKLAIAFTHFDLIKGSNLSTNIDRRNHVMASVLSALAKLREYIGSEVVTSIEHGLDDRCFMLGGTDRLLRALPPKAGKYMRGQLETMLDLFQSAALPQDEEIDANLTYDPTGMLFAVQDAVEKFRSPWRARLGLATFSNVRREHWTRIKALSKRIGSGSEVEYDTLQPLADLHRHLQEAISLFLDNPTSGPLDEEQSKAVSRIRRLVASGLLAITRRRLIEDQLVPWSEAFVRESGPGSTWRRANRIEKIYQIAAPVPQAAMTPEARKFLDEMVDTVSSSIQAVGGAMRR
jgi:energy-coupling factor transporter ATP-binding protein EcfA2